MIAERDEETTHHFRGKWFGFGPVRNDESLIFAVFETTAISGRRLNIKSFDRKKLIAAEQSIARQALVKKTVFENGVARRGEAVKGKFLGLATAKAGAIRGIFSEGWPEVAPKKLFGFGILDLVEDGDFDGHGTIGFLIKATVPNKRELGALREFFILDLADKFSEIHSIEECAWASSVGIGVARFGTIWRALISYPP
jgi:hypothetical protein